MNKEETRFSTILEILLKFTQKDFSRKIPITEVHDELNGRVAANGTVNQGATFYISLPD